VVASKEIYPWEHVVERLNSMKCFQPRSSVTMAHLIEVSTIIESENITTLGSLCGRVLPGIEPAEVFEVMHVLIMEHLPVFAFYADRDKTTMKNMVYVDAWRTSKGEGPLKDRIDEISKVCVFNVMCASVV
jgi:hypothetical protein